MDLSGNRPARKGKIIKITQDENGVSHIDWEKIFDRMPEAVAVVDDRTPVRRAEQDLGGRLLSLMNNIPGVVYRGLRDWSVVFIGADVERITGSTAEEFLSGKAKWRDLIHPDDLEHVKSTFREAVRAGRKVLHVEYRAVHKDGTVRWISDRRQLFYDDDGAFAYVDGLLLDVSSQKQAEEALRKSEDQLRQSQKMEAIGRLAGGVAHDFNNLLTAIRGYSDLLLLRLDGRSPMRREVEEIQKAGERATSLTRQLLAFSRKQVLQPKMMDLNAIVADTDKMLRRLIGENIDLVTVLKPDLGLVLVDPGQVEQVLMNLVVNARDAMPRGGKVTIETANVVLGEGYSKEHRMVEPGPYVMLAISDTGVGMDEKTKTHLFEPFFTTKEKGKGTGLGLSTVYGIVKQSGGYVWVYSEVGQGATFKVYFPRHDGVGVETETEAGGSPSPAGRETVLVVEDEEVVRALVRQILEDSGYTDEAIVHHGVLESGIS
ncbi:MAG: PAS domain-containing protein, partial [Candidatus Deferrimicrobiota bacterium]